MKVTLLLDYPDNSNPQFGADMVLHGGKVEVVQFGDLFAEVDHPISQVPCNGVTENGLLPCPFCGSTDIDPEMWSSNGGDSGPGCMNCGAANDSFEAWNRRV